MIYRKFCCKKKGRKNKDGDLYYHNKQYIIISEFIITRNYSLYNKWVTITNTHTQITPIINGVSEILLWEEEEKEKKMMLVWFIILYIGNKRGIGK